MSYRAMQGRSEPGEFPLPEYRVFAAGQVLLDKQVLSPPHLYCCVQRYYALHFRYCGYHYYDYHGCCRGYYVRHRSDGSGGLHDCHARNYADWNYAIYANYVNDVLPLHPKRKERS